jgi:hypothetical protein
MTDFHTTIDKAASLHMTAANFLANPCEENYWDLVRAARDYQDYYFQESSKTSEPVSKVKILYHYTLSLDKYGHLTIVQNISGKEVYLQVSSDISAICADLHPEDLEELEKGYPIELDNSDFSDYFGGCHE